MPEKRTFIFEPGVGYREVDSDESAEFGALNPSMSRAGSRLVSAAEFYAMGARDWGKAGGIDIADIQVEIELAAAEPNWPYIAPTGRTVRWVHQPVGYVPWALLNLTAEVWEFTDQGEVLTLDTLITANAPLVVTEVEGGNTDSVTGQTDLGYDVSPIAPQSGSAEGWIVSGVDNNDPLKLEVTLWPFTTGLAIIRSSLSVLMVPHELEDEVKRLFMSVQKSGLKERGSR